MWKVMRVEAQKASANEPLMASFFHSNILNHSDFSSAISFYLSNHIATDDVPAMTLRSVFQQAMVSDPSIEERMLQDLLAHYTRDPACGEYITPFLYFQGYHAVQTYRIAHWLWLQGRTLLASYMQGRIFEQFDLDIHPAASIAGGVMIDHAIGVIIGETAMIERDASMLHEITLEGGDVSCGNRHPVIRQGALLGAGSKVLGNIELGEGVKIGSGSVVLDNIPARQTAVGVPARVVGQVSSEMPALDMDHQLDDV